MFSKSRKTFSQQVTAERKSIMSAFVQAKAQLEGLQKKIMGRRSDIKKEQLALKEEDKFLEQEFISNKGSVKQLTNIISPPVNKNA